MGFDDHDGEDAVPAAPADKGTPGGQVRKVLAWAVHQHGVGYDPDRDIHQLQRRGRAHAVSAGLRLLC